jgi:serine protease DegS
MSVSKLARFLLQGVVIGTVAAVLLLWLGPDEEARPRVELRQDAGPRAAGSNGPGSYADAVATAAPAVVNIYTRTTVRRSAHPLLDDPVFRRFFGDQFGGPRERTQTSLGSGVIISPQGYLMTNYHVVAEADEIEVLLADGRALTAALIGSDPETDLAVLRVDSDDLPVATVGTAEDLRVGDVVLAIGNPFGVGQTVTLGIVSATGRSRLGINTFEDFIQTDAAINPGNSGGALIDASGRVVGINTAIVSRSGGSLGIGFAIPVEIAQDVLTQILESGRVVRGWLGIEAQQLTPALAESFGIEEGSGVVVAGVMRGGPAYDAGLRPGDIILELNGTVIDEPQDALEIIARQRPGSRLDIKALREGEPLETEATVVQRPQQS